MLTPLLRGILPLLLAAGIAAAGEVEIVAHRGDFSAAPENSLAAFRAAWRSGVRYVELDVRQSADGAYICCHDRDLRRVTGGAAGDRPVRRMTLAEIKRYPLVAGKGGPATGEKVPTLDEVLAELPKDAGIFLEIKSVGAKFPLHLAAMIEKHHIAKERITVISFRASALANLNRRTPGFRTLLLLNLMPPDKGATAPKLTAEELIDRLKKLGVSGVGAKIPAGVDASYIRKVRDAGFVFHVSVVNREAAARRFRDLGADSISSNRAAALQAALR